MLENISVEKCVAILAYLFMLAGVYFRRRKELHVKLMATSILLDLSLVLFLQFKVNAVHSAVTKEYNFLQYSHIVVSTLAVLVYPVVIFLGVKRLLNPLSSPNIRKWHIRFGLTAFTFRSLGFLFMFSM